MSDQRLQMQTQDKKNAYAINGKIKTTRFRTSRLIFFITECHPRLCNVHILSIPHAIKYDWLLHCTPFCRRPLLHKSSASTSPALPPISRFHHSTITFTWIPGLEGLPEHNPIGWRNQTDDLNPQDLTRNFCRKELENTQNKNSPNYSTFIFEMS